MAEMTFKERVVYGLKLAVNIGALYLMSLLAGGSGDNHQSLAIVPLIAAAAISAAAGMGQGLLAGNAARKASDKARRALERVHSPTVDDLMIELHDFVRQGEMTVEEAETFLQEATELENIQTTPEFRAYQTDVLSRLGETVADEGMDAQWAADKNQVEQDATRIARGETESILANRRARGIAGSGDELAAQLQSGQSAANRMSTLGYDAAAQAEARKMQALQSLFSGAGQMHSQDYEEQLNEAKAQDIINEFNTRQRQSQTNLNVANRNAATAANLAEGQRIADTNTGLRNEEEKQRVAAQQQRFENEYRKAGGQATVLQNQGQQAVQQGAANQNVFGNLATAFGQQAQQDKRDEQFAELLKAKGGVQ